VAFLTQVRAVPNLLTVMRLFILPFLVIAILDNNYSLAFGLFLLAGLSDMLDGLLARWLQQKTTLGLYLDPIADKLLLSTLFMVLTHQGLIPRYVTVLVFSRDLGILLISTLLMVGVVSVMLERLWPVPWLSAASRGLLQLIAVLAPVSAAQYAWIVFRRINTQTPTAA
jgi:cardiolipin synthase